MKDGVCLATDEKTKSIWIQQTLNSSSLFEDCSDIVKCNSIEVMPIICEDNE